MCTSGRREHEAACARVPWLYVGNLESVFHATSQQVPHVWARGLRAKRMCVCAQAAGENMRRRVRASPGCMWEILSPCSMRHRVGS